MGAKSITEIFPEMISKTISRKIYSLYLQGMTVEYIFFNISMKKDGLTIEEINAIIDHQNALKL